MAGVSSVIIKIGAQTAEAVAGIDKVNQAIGKTQTSGQKLQGAIKAAAIPAAAAFTALAGAAVLSAKAAAEDQASREQLDSQIRRTTGATEDAIKANETWIDSTSRATAVSKDELRPALAGLVRTTGDLTESHQLLQLALDTSAATGKNLSTVSSAIAKAYGGQYGALQRLVPSITAAAKSGQGFAYVQAVLNHQVEGAAKGEADTAAGQYRNLQLSIHDLEVAIGTGLLPALQAVLPIATQFFDLAGKHPDAILAVGGAIMALSGAVLAANAALKLYEAYQVAARIATSLTTEATITQRATMIATRVATLAYRAAMAAVRIATLAWAAAQWLLNAAMDANPIGIAIVAVAALTAAVIVAYRHSATFRQIVHEAFDAVAAAARIAWSAITSVASTVAHLASLGGSLRSGLVSALNAILSAIRAVESAIDGLISKIGSIHFPHIPSLPGLSLASYAGGPAVGGLAAGGYAGGSTININVTGAIDPEATAIAIRNTLDRYDRRRGRGWTQTQPGTGGGSRR